MKPFKTFLLILPAFALCSCATQGGTSSKTSHNPDAYSVQVNYEDGSPVSGGAYAQWCTTKLCNRPITLDATGYAEATYQDNDFVIHLGNLPSGDVYNANAYTANASKKHNDVTVYHASSYASGDGTKESPYVLTGDSVYNITLSESGKPLYFSFVSDGSSYQAESWASMTQADASTDPWLRDYGASSSFDGDFVLEDSSGVGTNFRYAFPSLSSGTSGFFSIGVDAEAQFFPISFPVILQKL